MCEYRLPTATHRVLPLGNRHVFRQILHRPPGVDVRPAKKRKKSKRQKLLGKDSLFRNKIDLDVKAKSEAAGK